MSSRFPMCLVPALGLLVSCRGGASSDSPRPADQATAATASGSSAATQMDLGNELDAIDSSPDPAGAITALRSKWQGKHLTWTVDRQEMLCRSADSCNVIPFPAPHEKDAPRHGWLPALEFAPGQFAKLTAACGDATRCQLTFEGALTDLEVDLETPTSLRFTDVHIVTATAEAAPPPPAPATTAATAANTHTGT